MIDSEVLEALNHPLLASHKEKILASAKPSVAIELTRQDKGLTLWQSKVGGDPYLPKGADYPRHPDGHALTLLAQINFAEVPKLPDFPEKGILQFFIDGTDEDECYGMNWDNQREQTGFRVVYYADVLENIDDLVTDFSPYAVENREYGLPFVGQYSMAFQLGKQVLTTADFHWSRLLGFPEFCSEEWDNLDEEEEQGLYEVIEYYSDNIDETGHRLGGYPHFTQDDPRAYKDTVIQDYILLFQIDTDWEDGKEIMWGDGGVANFFINPDDLKNLDFSKVLYTWDCC